jgi:hypothetical protein
MHQWWTASLTIPAFVYCVHLAIRMIAARLPRFAVAHQAWVTGAVLLVVFWSSASERILAVRQRATVLTETLDAPRALRGIRTDKPTAEAFHAIYQAMVNFKRHHPTARVVSNDHCDGFSNCVAESLLWLSFLDDNPRDHPIYWPMPVLSTTLYPDYNQKFRDSIQHTPALIVDSWTGANLPDNGIPGYDLLVGVRNPVGYWYVFAPIHPEAVAHGEATTRLDQSGYPPGNRRVNPWGWRRGFEYAVNPTTGAERKLPLYTWPVDLAVSPLREPQPLDVRTAQVRAGELTVDRSRWIVRGNVAPYSSLFDFEERLVQRGDYFVATGTIQQGSCRVLLIRNGTADGYIEITQPGPFAVVLMPPSSGRYRLAFTNGIPVLWWQVVEAHGLSGLVGLLVHGLPRQIAFDVDEAGWVAKDAPSPVNLVYRRDHPWVQLDSDEHLREAEASAASTDAEEQLAETRRVEERHAEDRRAKERTAAAEQSERQTAAQDKLRHAVLTAPGGQ